MVEITVARNSHTLTIKKEIHRKGSLAKEVILFTNQKKTNKKGTLTNKKATANSTAKSYGKSHGK